MHGSSLPAQDVPVICRLLGVWTLASANPPLHPLTISPLSCLACFWPPFLLMHAMTPANCHRQVSLDSSLIRSLRRDLRLPSEPQITHILCALFELSHISTSFGTWKAAPQSMSGRKMLLYMRQEFKMIKLVTLQLRGFLNVPIRKQLFKRLIDSKWIHVCMHLSS